MTHELAKQLFELSAEVFFAEAVDDLVDDCTTIVATVRLHICPASTQHG